MFANTKWIAPLLAIGLFASGARASDESDIKSAAKDFAVAFSQGNAAEAKAHATSDDTTVAVIESIAPVVAASLKLHDASVEKFGKDGEQVVQNPARGISDWSKHADDAVVKVQGNTATLSENPGASDAAPKGQPLHLKKVGGKWKVDLSSFPNGQKLKQQAPALNATATAYSEAADEVKAGKYQSAAEARLAVAQKVRAAILDLRTNLPPGRIRGGAGAGGAGGAGGRGGQ